MTVYVADAHAQAQKLVSVAKTATVPQECITEEQRSVLCFFFCGKNDSVQNIFIKKSFLFTVVSECRVKWFQLGGKCFADDEEVETEVRKWLKQ
jgi:hypothetical protein